MQSPLSQLRIALTHTAATATSGYTVDDLDWLGDEIGVAHLELDPWGSLVVSPAGDEHELAQGALVRQAGAQLDSTYVVLPSFSWTVPAAPDTSASPT